MRRIRERIKKAVPKDIPKTVVLKKYNVIKFSMFGSMQVEYHLVKCNSVLPLAENYLSRYRNTSKVYVHRNKYTVVQANKSTTLQQQ